MLVRTGVKKLSGCLGDDEDAHEKDHDEEDPHEESVHHLGDLLPLCHLDTRCSLLTEAVGDVLNVLHHLKEDEGVQRSWKEKQQIAADNEVSHLFMLEAGAAAGACWDLVLLIWVETRLFRPPVQVLEVSGMRRALVVQLVPPDVVVGLSPLQPGSVVVLVVVVVIFAAGAAVCLAFVMLVVMMSGLAVAVLVRRFLMVEATVDAVIIVASLFSHGLLQVQRTLLTLWSRAVFPDFVNKKNLRHVVDD